MSHDVLLLRCQLGAPSGLESSRPHVVARPQRASCAGWQHRSPCLVASSATAAVTVKKVPVRRPGSLGTGTERLERQRLSAPRPEKWRANT